MQKSFFVTGRAEHESCVLSHMKKGGRHLVVGISDSTATREREKTAIGRPRHSERRISAGSGGGLALTVMVVTIIKVRVCGCLRVTTSDDNSSYRRFYEGRQRVEPRGDNGVADGVRGQPTGEVCRGHMCPKW
jgi:hypothetical protein